MFKSNNNCVNTTSKTRKSQVKFTNSTMSLNVYTYTHCTVECTELFIEGSFRKVNNPPARIKPLWEVLLLQVCAENTYGILGSSNCIVSVFTLY